MRLTTYRQAMLLCGLNFPEAAVLHGRTEETVRKYSSGDRAVPDDLWQQLIDLQQQIATAALRSTPPARADFPHFGPWHAAFVLWGMTHGLGAVELAHNELVRKAEAQNAA